MEEWSDYKQGFVAGFDRYFEELLDEAERVKDRIELQWTGIGSTETYNKGFAQGLAEAESNALTSLTFESRQAEAEADFFDEDPSETGLVDPAPTKEEK